MITKAFAEAELERWKGIATKLSTTGVTSFQLGDSGQTLVTMEDVQRQIGRWQRTVNELSAAAAAGSDGFAASQPGVAVARVR